jgi:hypothetical protein
MAVSQHLRSMSSTASVPTGRFVRAGVAGVQDRQAGPLPFAAQLPTERARASRVGA